MKTQAVVISEQGDPGVMSVTDVDIGSPGPGEVLLEQSAIGLNYMDVYQRSGHYRLDLPSGLGLEAAGRVLEIGNGVTSVQVDDRVAYAGGLPGAYANHRIVPVDRLVPIPDGVSERTVARRRKQQPHAELGNGDLGIVRCFGNHDAALARRVKIERLKAGAPHRDDFDIGQSIQQFPVVAAKTARHQAGDAGADFGKKGILVVGGVEPVQREMLLDRRRVFRRDIGRQQDLCRNWTLPPSCHAECQKTVYRMN